MTDLHDPDFWAKMLGEEADEAEGEELDGDVRMTEGGGVSRFSQRAVQAPNRLQAQLEASRDAAGGKQKAKGKEKEGAPLEEEVTWTKVQLQAVLTGIFSLGYGRTETLAARNASLASRPAGLVAEAIDYACSLGMALMRSAEADRDHTAADDADDDGDPERERRLWHSLQTGRPPLPGAPLVPTPIVKPLRMDLAQWYARCRWSRSSSTCAASRTRSRPPAPRLPRRRCPRATAGRTPVSYTHLTLPTICSV